MRFILRTSGHFYEKAADRAELESLGFKFIHDEPQHEWDKRFAWRKVDEGDEPSIELNSLEELMGFAKKYGDLILSSTEDRESRHEVGTPVLQIYDDYRE